jgi:hypothetical protein
MTSAGAASIRAVGGLPLVLCGAFLIALALFYGGFGPYSGVVQGYWRSIRGGGVVLIATAAVQGGLGVGAVMLGRKLCTGGLFRSRRGLAFAASVLVPILITMAAILVADTLKVEPYLQSSECAVSTCGPLIVADCKAATDGPLLIYTRYPKLLLTDCGFWSMTTWRAMYCEPLYTATSACGLYPGWMHAE